MEWVILMAIVFSSCNICSKIDNLANKQANTSKGHIPPLKELVGKNIHLQLRDELDIIYGDETEGILKEYNSKWLILETKDKKGKIYSYYYRINSIVSIDVVSED